VTTFINRDGGREKEEEKNTPLTYSAMAAFRSLRRRLPLALLLAVCVAASRSDPSGDDFYNRSICKLQPYRCGEVNITYPFYLSDDTADVLGNSSSYCGYPGLAIDCVDDEYPTIQLGGNSSNTGYSYNVTDIDYPTSTIYLADPDVLDDASCPRVDHNVTVSPSPTLWLNLSDYTVRYLLFFANCSINVLHVPNQSDISPIACASGSDGDDYSFVVPSEMPHQLLSQQCGQVTLVPVLQNATLTPVDPLWSTSGYRDALKQGFQLQWDSDMKTERCDDCERSSGKCAYNTSGEFVACLCADGHVTDHGCTNGTPSLSRPTFHFLIRSLGFSLLRGSIYCLAASHQTCFRFKFYLDTESCFASTKKINRSCTDGSEWKDERSVDISQPVSKFSHSLLA
jgi:hypothetical protein